MDEAGWTDEVMDRAEELLPALVAAGYASMDDETTTSYTWRFTPAGVARMQKLRPGEADRA
jgi:hypothetical protein